MAFHCCLTFDEARELLTDAHSCLRLQSIQRHMALLPRYSGNIRVGIKEQLQASVGIYTQKLGGCLLAYHNVQCLQCHSRVMDEQPHLHFDIRLDCIVFQPSLGSVLRGTINLVSRSHIGGLVHDYYNFSIPHSGARDAWRCGQTLLFEVSSVESQNGVLSIKGTLVDSSTRTATAFGSPHERDVCSVASCDSGVDLSLSGDKHKTDRGPSLWSSVESKTDPGPSLWVDQSATRSKRKRKTSEIESPAEVKHHKKRKVKEPETPRVALFKDESCADSETTPVKHRKKKRASVCD